MRIICPTFQRGTAEDRAGVKGGEVIVHDFQRNTERNTEKIIAPKRKRGCSQMAGKADCVEKQEKKNWSRRGVG